MPGLSISDVDLLDNKLRFYCWDEITDWDEKYLLKLADTNNFNTDNYDEAVSIYLYWKNSILPTLAPEEHDSTRICFGQQVYNILHLLAPNHHIHLALKK